MFLVLEMAAVPEGDLPRDDGRSDQRACSVHQPELRFIENADHLGEVMAAL